jgi:hypothetical protein
MTTLLSVAFICRAYPTVLQARKRVLSHFLIKWREKIQDYHQFYLHPAKCLALELKSALIRVKIHAF